tara:strand:- start:287 stop:658 length:372 start_codon:yes stop_codon:yes gene_type:complete
MSDYTVEELQQMLNDKLAAEATSSQLSMLDTFLDSVTAANDCESQKVESNGIIVGNVLKSSSENRQYIEQRHYTNEMEDGEIVGRAVTYISYTTGSYSDSLTMPSLQVVGERIKNRTVLKGSS